MPDWLVFSQSAFCVTVILKYKRRAFGTAFSFCDMNFDQLRTEGYQVFRGVLSEDEVAKGRDLFFKWYDKNRPIPTPHGIIQHYDAGQSAFAWFTRTNQKVSAIFKALWGADRLVCSFDGQCYWKADSMTKRPNKNWLHIDQPLNAPEFQCVQGLVAYSDNALGSLVVVPGSSKAVAQGVLYDPKGSKAFNIVPESRLAEFNDPIVVDLKKGDVVLWDSRTLHQNRYSAEERLVQYVCYLPAAGLSKAQALKRINYYLDKRSTSHWPYPVRVNAKQPQVYGDKSKLIDYSKVDESEEGKLWLAAHNFEIAQLVGL